MAIANILVASDLSEQSDRAIRRAAQLAALHDASLRVLHVVDTGTRPLPAMVAKEVRSSAKSDLSDVLAPMQKGLAEVQIDVRFGSAWRTILAVAEETGADLIVVGPRGYRGLREMFLGTVVERIVNSATVPVLLVNSDTTAPYRQAVVGVDFSPSSQKAATHAARLAPNAPINLTTTYHISFRAFIDRAAPGDRDIQAERKRIERELDARMADFMETCIAHPAGYKVAFLEGGPAEGLARHAGKQDADLICVGSHGRNWVAEAFLGSTARDLLDSAPCDLLIAEP